MKWEITKNNYSQEEISNIAAEFNIDEFLVSIFTSRGMNKDDVRVFFNDTSEAILDPSLLTNAQEAAERIAYHIKNDSFINIYADYDSDGVNSGYIIESVINNIVKNTSYRPIVAVKYPEREDGYGLSMDYAKSMVYLHEASPKRGMLVLTVDNGVAQVEQINHMVDNGIEVIVTDHHQSKDEVPNCLIVDPHNEHDDQDSIYKHLCGAGVIFKVCELVQLIFGFHDMYKYVPNVAIATITDVMPMTLENMAFIKYGLEVMNSDDINYNVGLKTLFEYMSNTSVDTISVAFELGPRINACGRMGNTELASKLLLEEDKDKAVDLVNEVDLLNEKRKALTKTYVNKAMKDKSVNDKVIVCAIEDIPIGIVGIIAGKLNEKFAKPTIVLTSHKKSNWHGSMRGLHGVNMLDYLKQEFEAGNIINYGGHEAAAGLTIEYDNVDNFRESLNSRYDEVVVLSEVEETIYIDFSIELADVNKDLFNRINIIPYSKTTFPQPVFIVEKCEVVKWNVTKNNPDNMMITLRQGRKLMSMWCEGIAKRYKSIGCPQFINIVGNISKNFIETGTPYIITVKDVEPYEIVGEA